MYVCVHVCVCVCVYVCVFVCVCVCVCVCLHIIVICYGYQVNEFQIVLMNGNWRNLNMIMWD